MTRSALPASFEYLNYVIWVYGHYKYFIYFSAGTVFRRQSLASKVDPRALRLKRSIRPGRKVSYLLGYILYILML